MGNLNLQECQPVKSYPLNTISGPAVELPELASLHGTFLKIIQATKHHDRRNDMRSPVRKKTAIIFEDHTMSFGQLDRLSDALMSVLADMLALCREDEHHRVAVHMEPSLNLIVVIFAVLKLKAAVIPFDTYCPPDRTAYMITHSKPSIIICDDPGKLRDFATHVVIVEAEKLLEVARQPCRHFACPVFHISDQNLPAVVLYTSGTPARSVTLSHRLIMNRIIWQWNELPFQEEEMGLLTNVMTATSGWLEVFSTLLAGRTLLIVRNKILKYPSELFSVLQKYPVRRITIVPSFLRYICDYMEEEGKIFYGALEMVMVTGEILSFNLAQRFYTHFTQTKLGNFYSLTEAAGDILWMLFDSRSHFENVCIDGIVPVGRVVNNFSVTVVDENLHPAVRKGWGELAVTSALVSTSSRSTFQLLGDGRLWHRTGDLAFIHPSTGLIYVKGPITDQIRIGGKRFHLSEIEDLLNQIPSIRDAAVVKINDDSGNCKKIYAFYYSGGSGESEDDLAAHKAKKSVRSHLPAYVVQPSFVRCDEPFPVLANGKVDRKKLFSMFEEKVVGWENIDVATPLSTIANVLGKPVGSIDLDKSFAENGGTSVHTVNTILQLSKAGFKLALADFLSATTVREIVVRCEWVPPNTPPSIDSPGKPEFCAVEFSLAVREKIVALFTAAVSGEPSEFSEEYPRLTSGELRKIAEKFFDEVSGENDSVGMFCFGVKVKEDIVAVTAAYDIYGNFAKTQTLFSGPPGPVSQLMHNALMPLLTGIPQKPGTVVRNFLMTTDASLPSQQSIALFNFMELELENRAKYSAFHYVVTVNSNRTRQQLAELRGAERWATYQANRLALLDGSVPLYDAADSLKITVDVCSLSRKTDV